MNLRKLLIGTLLVFVVLVIGALSFSTVVTREQEFRGVLERGFENSHFVEQATSEFSPELDVTNHGWLNFEPGSLPPHPCIDEASVYYDPWLAGTYEIKFIGRRIPGPSGHLNQWPAEYIVEELLEVRPLPDACKVRTAK